MKIEGSQGVSRGNEGEIAENKAKRVEDDNQLLRSKLKSSELELSQQELNTSSTISK
jgi:hypothetical protein